MKRPALPSQPALPWRVDVHFSDFPHGRILRMENYDALRDHFMARLKEVVPGTGEGRGGMRGWWWWCGVASLTLFDLTCLNLTCLRLTFSLDGTARPHARTPSHPRMATVGLHTLRFHRQGHEPVQERPDPAMEQSVEW